MLELHEWQHSRAVLRGGGGGDVTSLPDTWVGNHPGLPGPRSPSNSDAEENAAFLREAGVLIELGPAFPADAFAP